MPSSSAAGCSASLHLHAGASLHESGSFRFTMKSAYLGRLRVLVTATLMAATAGSIENLPQCAGESVSTSPMASVSAFTPFARR